MAVNKTPIALFTYNRPVHTQQALDALSRCACLGECDLHIYCDGPKSPEGTAAVEASRQVVRQWASQSKVTVIERPRNLGLARSIVSGVTELCQRYGWVIVLEDDFVVSPDFVDYMLQALDRYQDEPEVYQISGYMFAVEHPPQPDAFFLPLTTTRGWATWDRAWRIFDWSATGSREQLADPQTRRHFDLDDSYPYSAMLKRQLAGQLDSWGILWWWAVFKVNGLVLHPRQSLVWVGGFDDSGTHCGTGSDFPQLRREAFMNPRLSQPITLPERIVEKRAAFNRIKTFIRTQGRHRRSLMVRISRWIRQQSQKSRA